MTLPFISNLEALSVDPIYFLLIEYTVYYRLSTTILINGNINKKTVTTLKYINNIKVFKKAFVVVRSKKWQFSNYVDFLRYSTSEFFHFKLLD